MANGDGMVTCKVCQKEFTKKAISGHMAGHARRGEYTSPYATKPNATTRVTRLIPVEMIDAMVAKINHKDSTISIDKDCIMIYV
jgi:hypothetical protein